MAEQTIVCPNCRTEIALNEAITGAIQDKIRSQLQQELQQNNLKLQQRETALKEREKQTAAKEAAIEQQIQQKLAHERESLTQQLEMKLRQEKEVQDKALQEELAEKNNQLKQAREQELALRKEKRELEQSRAELELTVQRKLDEERKKIAQEANEKAVEAQLLKMREKDELINSMQGKISQLQRQVEQGSQERQGEALEGQLQETLARAFPYDDFEEVVKGKRGGDILQRVHNSNGKVCGTILWESKNTKDFQRPWIDKLKQDQQNAGADIAILMTMALPREVRNFDLYEEVWITDYKSAHGLCAALRQQLINLAREKMVVAHQDSLKDVIYNYITGQDFARRIKTVVAAYRQMQQDLDKERNAMARIWKKREKQIGAVLGNMTEMYGELEGMLGQARALPPIDTLSLEAIAEENIENDEKE
ncbi:MAG: DUF2130 domain-containing protein [Sedimentisphaerales bacterium]|nr:DUF2130 domain-containing protein [Sedimentisphaerales bacterium]